MTIDKKQSPYKPKIYQGRFRNQNRNQQNFTPRNRFFSTTRSPSGNGGNYNYRNNYQPNYRNRSRGRWNNHRSGDRSNNYQTNNRQIMDITLNRHLETEVKVEMELEITMMTI